MANKKVCVSFDYEMTEDIIIYWRHGMIILV